MINFKIQQECNTTLVALGDNRISTKRTPAEEAERQAVLAWKKAEMQQQKAERIAYL
jgi:hypothetical protein